MSAVRTAPSPAPSNALASWGAWGPEVPHLGYGELAIVLYAAGLPTTDPRGEELARYADLGIARLGGLQEVRRLRQWRNDLATAVEQGQLTGDEFAELTKVYWDDEDLLERCRLLDYQRLPR